MFWSFWRFARVALIDGHETVEIVDMVEIVGMVDMVHSPSLRFGKCVVIFSGHFHSLAVNTMYPLVSRAS